MKGRYFARCIGTGICCAAAIFALSYAFMLLWNWIMPEVFGLHVISYLQAFGLLILSKLVFGGFRGRWGGHCGSCCGRGSGGSWRSRWEDKWSKMTPEEKEKIKKGFGGRCGYYGEEKNPE